MGLGPQRRRGGVAAAAPKSQSAYILRTEPVRTERQPSL